MNKVENILYSPTHSTLSRKILLIAVGTILLGIAAQLSIPWKPVPLTFQSSAVILLGMLYGSRLGASVVASYLIAGFCGLPVFAGGVGGPAYLWCPTVGYLFAFLPAAFVTGYLAERGLANHFIKAFLTACVGAFLIFLGGYAVLAIFIGFHAAWVSGVLPFIVTESLKLLAVALIVPNFWRASSDRKASSF